MSEDLLTTLETLQRVEMACHLLIALDIKRRRDGLEKTWISTYEATSIILADFKKGAVRPFIEKLKKSGAFDYIIKQDGRRNEEVFRFTSSSEQKLLARLKRLADLLFRLFPAPATQDSRPR